MTAAALIHDLADAGIRLSRNGDKLRVEGKPGTITPELRLVLTQHKIELLAALNDDPRATLVTLADAEGIDIELVRHLSDADITECAGLPTETLRAYVHTLRDEDLRRRGKVPPDETARALCAHCGPVWIHPAVAAVAPVVDSWPRVLGCAWCHVKGYVPRPPVRCGDCQHLERDHVNPEGGMGRCKAGHDPTRPWPNAAQQCRGFTP